MGGSILNTKASPFPQLATSPDPSRWTYPTPSQSTFLANALAPGPWLQHHPSAHLGVHSQSGNPTIGVICSLSGGRPDPAPLNCFPRHQQGKGSQQASISSGMVDAQKNIPHRGWTPKSGIGSNRTAETHEIVFFGCLVHFLHANEAMAFVYSHCCQFCALKCKLQSTKYKVEHSFLGHCGKKMHAHEGSTWELNNVSCALVLRCNHQQQESPKLDTVAIHVGTRWCL